MIRHFFQMIVLLFTSLVLISCSSDLNEPTVEETMAEQDGRLSRDDAEVLIYERLTSEEQQTYTVDFVKEAQSLYYIRVYDDRQVKKTFTVNSHTEEVEQLE